MAKRHHAWVLGLWGFLGSFVWAIPASAVDVAAMLDRSLEVGASVTAGKNPYRVPARIDSPGKRLTSRYGVDGNLLSYGKDGSNSLDSMNRVPATEWSTRSMILAIDLFFWDSRHTGKDCTDSVARVMEFAALMKKNQLYWLVGTIPNMSEGTVMKISQPCRDALNLQILSSCSGDAACTLADFNSLRAKLLADGGLTYKGKHYSFLQLQPDGLHLSGVASEHIVDLIQSRLEGNAEPFVFKGTNCGYFEGTGPACVIP